MFAISKYWVFSMKRRSAVAAIETPATATLVSD
jgi:hypothetical protein